MLRGWNSIVNGWLPDLLIWFFVSMAAYRLMKPRLKSFAKRLALSRSLRSSDPGNRDINFKSKSGIVKIAAQAVPIFCLAVMIAASIAIPLERAVSADQIVTARNLYLPHVAEELDAYHFWAINPVGDRMLLQFCPDHGIKPPFDEGETITWLRYRRVGDCLELLGADAIRDGNNKVTRR